MGLSAGLTQHCKRTRFLPRSTKRFFIMKLEMKDAANTEYPFFAFVPGAPPNTTFQLFTPETYYTPADSLKHFRTAHRLLSALQVLSPEVKAWKIRLCRLI